ncbi:septation protein SepH [Mycetocola spongiae]|uniref:septation protein SepH n=1 Tax=Mycetocola spongiae TaxID=2859226 RepID=UPI001CF29A05|nr:septation protein SepH [Mycetocola spongiae]UCR89516.1 DUF3071 domain-containing protein [Mycetocola spongiae]
MQDLKVIGVEDGALIAAAENGDRYRLVIDEVLQSQLRRMKTTPTATPALRPREIQAQIRAGLSAAEVAELTGADLDYIQRFEGPILAEREHMVVAALSVPVVAAIEPGAELEDATFGAAIRARLESLGAEGERWTSWKDEEEGWIIKLSFTANRVDHDARWSFEAKRHILTPNNSEAITLSKQGELPAQLIPRLRAVETAEDPADARFDSGAFSPVTEPVDPAVIEAAARVVPAGSNAAADAAINRAEARDDDGNQHTADLLQALRKRRGERESRAEREARLESDQRLAAARDAETGFGLRPVDVPLENFETLAGDATPAAEGEPEAVIEAVETPPAHVGDDTAAIRNRRGRKAMPSWDEIVFGARTDED